MTTLTYSGVAQFRDQNATAQNGGSATNPTAATAITSITIPAAGMWEVQVWAFFSGTIAAGDLNNMNVKQGATVRWTALPLVAAAATTQPQTPFTLVLACNTGDVVSVTAVGNASGASAVYNAGLTARQVG